MLRGISSQAARRGLAPMSAIIIRAPTASQSRFFSTTAGSTTSTASLPASASSRSFSSSAAAAANQFTAVACNVTPPASASAPSQQQSGAASAMPNDPTLRNRGTKLLGRSVYLDAQATTPLDPRVLDAMLPYFTQQYGNPHSRTHHYGWEADDAVEKARAEVADLIGASPQEIIFTSGATESNNTAIKGIMRFLKSKKKHIITTQVEHKCILDACRAMQQEGFEVTYLPVLSSGLVDLKVFEAAIRPDTGLVSVMMVNNEIGTIQPIAEMGKICAAHGVKFHTDAAQAVGKIPVDVTALNVDSMSISSHKLYGPKGMGALYVRRRPRLRLEPLLSGGGQERGIRSGTVPAPLVVGMGAACRVAKEELENDSKHVRRLAERLYNGLTSRVCNSMFSNAYHDFYGRFLIR